MGCKLLEVLAGGREAWRRRRERREGGNWKVWLPCGEDWRTFLVCVSSAILLSPPPPPPMRNTVVQSNPPVKWKSCLSGDVLEKQWENIFCAFVWTYKLPSRRAPDLTNSSWFDCTTSAMPQEEIFFVAKFCGLWCCVLAPDARTRAKERERALLHGKILSHQAMLLTPGVPLSPYLFTASKETCGRCKHMVHTYKKLVAKRKKSFGTTFLRFLILLITEENSE